MYATRHNMPLAGLATEVSLDRRVAGEAVFEYGLELDGPITEGQRQELLQAAQSCPVYQTLSQKILFKYEPR